MFSVYRENIYILFIDSEQCKWSYMNNATYLRGMNILSTDSWNFNYL